MNGSLMGPAPTTTTTPAPASQAARKPDRVEASQEQYRTIRDVAPDWVFAAQFRKDRGALDTERQRVRDRMKPFRDQDERLTKELDRLDDVVRLAWQAGARSRDGKIIIDEVPADRRWSKGIVERVAVALGKTYDEIERLADFGTKLLVRWYR